MRLPAFLAVAALTAVAVPAFAQAARPAPHPARAIRTTIPITRAFERGLAAGTRDSSGRPTARYWQLRTDYTIDARLDPATATVTGREKVVITNPSDSALRFLGLHLDQNQFAPNVAREAPVAGITSGMHITRMVANGDAVDLTAPAVARWNTQTVVGVPLRTPIPARGTGTLEVEWSFEVPLVTPPTRGDRMGRWGNPAVPADPVVSARRRVRRSARLGPGALSRTVRVLQQLRPLRRPASTCPAGWIVSGTGVLQNPRRCSRRPARERLTHVLESRRQIRPSSAPPRRRRRPGDGGGRSARLAFRGRHGERLRVGHGEASSCGTPRARRFPGKGRADRTCYPARARALYERRRRSRATRSSSTRSSGCRTRSRSFTLQDGPSAGMEYPMVINSNQGAAPITRRVISGGR